MTVKEWFDSYLERAHVAVHGSFCIYASFSAGPGFYGFTNCNHEDHADVRYGKTYCPDYCKDYRCVDDEQLLKQFFTNYARNYDFYNRKLNIKMNDPYYIDNYGRLSTELLEKACRDFLNE